MHYSKPGFPGPGPLEIVGNRFKAAVGPWLYAAWLEPIGLRSNSTQIFADAKFKAMCRVLSCAATYAAGMATSSQLNPNM